MKKWKIVLIVIVSILIVGAGTACAYYAFVYQAPDAVSSRNNAELQAAYNNAVQQISGDLYKCSRRVMINVPYGGDHTGATAGDLKESELVLQIASMVRELNTDESLGIFLSRYSDMEFTEEQRQNIAEMVEADMIIDLHLPSYGDDSLAGVRCYYNSDYYRYDLTNEAWADMCMRGITENCGTMALSLTDIALDDELHADKAFEVLVNAKVPAVYIECGNIRNSTEGGALAKPGYCKSIAKGILAAIYEGVGSLDLSIIK